MCCENEAAKKNAIQVYLLLTNTDVAHWWTGRKYLGWSTVIRMDGEEKKLRKLNTKNVQQLWKYGAQF